MKKSVDQLRSDLKKRSNCINNFLECDKPNALLLWSIYDLDSKIDTNLRKLHFARGRLCKTFLDLK